ncbi:MAG: response regulator [Elusimicrobia bacterium]|nr:response regulator [Elusimicrobiota bacterium]
MKILIVDDEDFIVSSISKILEKEGFEVEGAGRVLEAKEKLKQKSFDLILSDVKMPGESGISLMDYIREKGIETGIVFMTGYGDIKDAVSVMKKGAFDYITKPFDREILLNVVKKYFEERKLKKELEKAKSIVGLYRIALTVARISSMDEILDEITSICREQILCDGGSVGIVDEETDSVFIRRAWGMRKEKAEGTIWKIGKRPSGFAVKERRGIIINGPLNTHPFFKGEEVFEPIKSGMSIPMLLGERVVGVLNFKRIKIEKPFTEEDLEKGFVLAEISALAISNARLFEEMKEIDELKSKFVLTVSHEMRNPLMILSASVEVLENSKNLDEVRKVIEILKRNVERMKYLIDDLLDYSKLEKGELKITKEKVSSRKIVQASISGLKQRAEKKNMEIKTYVEDFEIFCDAKRMEEVLVNLIDNAIKYAPQGTQIFVGAKKEEDRGIFWVEDEGVPISKKFHKKIFERFFRIDMPLASKKGSFGLGLSIVKELVRLHKGEVFIEAPPEGKNKGNKFIVVLPIENPAPLSGAGRGDK